MLKIGESFDDFYYLTILDKRRIVQGGERMPLLHMDRASSWPENGAGYSPGIVLLYKQIHSFNWKKGNNLTNELINS